MLNLSKYLNPSEEVQIIYRPSLASRWRDLSLAGFLLASALFLLWFLFQQGKWGLVVWGGLILLSLYSFLRARLLWQNTALILTKQRLLDVSRSGLFKEVISQTDYASIEDVSWSKQGLFAHLLGYGTVTVRYGRGAVQLKFPYLKDPKNLTEELLNRRQSNWSTF